MFSSILSRFTGVSICSRVAVISRYISYKVSDLVFYSREALYTQGNIFDLQLYWSTLVTAKITLH